MITERKKDNESNESLIRRFTRKVQSSGLLKHKKRTLFFQKKQNKRTRRLQAIARARTREQIEFLIKVGRMEEKAPSFRKHS